MKNDIVNEKFVVDDQDGTYQITCQICSRGNVEGISVIDPLYKKKRTENHDRWFVNLKKSLKRHILLNEHQEVYKSIKMKKDKQCATGSKILTEPEPDRIGIILAGTG